MFHQTCLVCLKHLPSWLIVVCVAWECVYACCTEFIFEICSVPSARLVMEQIIPIAYFIVCHHIDCFVVESVALLPAVHGICFQFEFSVSI